MTQNVTLSSGARKYSPIWKQIKEKGECRITCPVKDVVTIVKAVGKEKARDKKPPPKKALVHKVVGTDKPGEASIIFSLETKVTLEDL